MNTATPASSAAYQAEAHSAYFRRTWQAMQARGSDEPAALAALVAAPLVPVAIDAA